MIHFNPKIETEQLRELIGDKNLNIICADDVYFNLEALRIIFNKIGLLKNCHFVSNGQLLVDTCKNIVSFSDFETDDITVIVTDFEMPMLSGLEAIKEISAFYNHTNLKLNN